MINAIDGRCHFNISTVSFTFNRKQTRVKYSRKVCLRVSGWHIVGQRILSIFPRLFFSCGRAGPLEATVYIIARIRPLLFVVLAVISTCRHNGVARGHGGMRMNV